MNDSDLDDIVAFDTLLEKFQANEFTNEESGLEKAQIDRLLKKGILIRKGDKLQLNNAADLVEMDMELKADLKL